MSALARLSLFLSVHVQYGLEAIGLVLNVTDDKRAAYEEFMQTQPTFQTSGITKPKLTLPLSPQSPAPAYLPIMYTMLGSSLARYGPALQNMDMLPLP